VVAWTRASTTVDFERDGRQVGAIRLGHSVHRSAYGVLPIPIAVFKNGRGPTVLVMAGNHGDEYEGQVALTNLIRTFDPARLQGRLIVVPMANFPAARAGQRVSPVDGGNLNREFPGRADGTLTQQIAHYISAVLMPMADVFLDLHSGGSSLEYLPYALATVGGGPEKDRRTVAAMLAMGYPLGFVWPATPGTGTANDVAGPAGLIALSGEFGGKGFVTPAYVRMLERGIENLLAHLGMVAGKPAPPAKPTRIIVWPPEGGLVYAPVAGIWEPTNELGDTVAAGDTVALIHVPEEPLREPVRVAAPAAGMMLARRAMGRVEPGDCLAELCIDDPTDWRGSLT